MNAEVSNITPEEHSDIVGGSTAARRLGCPRSLHLEGLVPKDEGDSVFAREGTALHELMAVILQDGIDEPTSLLPFTYERKAEDGTVEWSFTVDFDLWDEKGSKALRIFDDFVERVETEWEEELEFLIEQRVAFPGIPGAYGTSDIVAKCGTEMFVIDWKFGHGPVEAEGNAQLMFYAVGAMNTCSAFLKHSPAGEERPVTLVIIQPMLSDEPLVWETDTTELADMAQRLRVAVDVARHQKNAAPVAKGPWCKYARCKTICPLHNRDVAGMSERMARAQARLTDEAEVAEVNAIAEAAGTPTRRELPEFDWGGLYAEMMSLVSTVEAWADEVKKQAYDAAMAGVNLPGFKLVPKAGGARNWAVGGAEVEKFFKNRRFTLDEYKPRKLVTLPAGEKMLKEAGKELPEEMINKPTSSGLKLVAEKSTTDAGELSPTAKINALRDRLAGLTEAG
jgi:hypothetical protein